MDFRNPLLKKPSAWIPIVLSAAALLLVIGALVFHDIPQTPSEDEGILAHVWQLLIGTQALFVFYFALRYLPTNSKQAVPILIVQIIVALAACVPVFLFHL
jgi:peptidoglycan/LPS O-acetylase OafA/YrhL